MKVIAGVIGGLLLAIIGGLVLALATAHSGSTGAGQTAFWVLWAIGFIVGLTAPTGGKAWRRVLVMCGLLCLCLPLASMVMTGTFVAHNSADGAAAAGGVIGGGLMTLFSGVVGFFLGAILLVIGLLCGRTPTTIIIHQAPGASPTANNP